MWWEPRNESEAFVADVVPRLREMFVEMVGDEVVFGVGAWFDDERSRPLLLVNSETFAELPPLSDLLELEAVPNLEYLRAWELPPDTVLLSVPRPEPSTATITTRSGVPIRSPETLSMATLGPALRRANEDDISAFLTVGHLFSTGAKHAKAELIIRDWPWPTRYRTIGRVVHCHNPFARGATGPGYDCAVVTLSPDFSLEGPVSKGVARIGALFHEPQRVSIFGAVSGVRQDAGIVGSLSVVGGKDGIWRNSWLLLPSGLTAPGDSGGLVAMPSGDAVAMIVGGSRLLSSNTYMVQYAQDMQSLCDDVLGPAGYELSSEL